MLVLGSACSGSITLGTGSAQNTDITPGGSGASGTGGGTSGNGGGGTNGGTNGGGAGGGSGTTMVPPSACDQPSSAAPARIVRLGQVDLQNTLGVLAGSAGSTAAATLEPDTRLNGFSNNADQKASAAFVAALNRIAEPVATAMVSQASGAGTFSTCTPGATKAEPCARTYLTQVAAKAWRRPATTDEVTDLMALYTLGRDVETTASDAQRLTTGLGYAVQSILQSPNFVYRTELGAGGAGRFALSPYEVASALSYAVASQPPDAELLAAAARDELQTGEQRLAQVRRLRAASPDAWRLRQRRFALEWAEIDLNAKAWAKQPSSYPTFNDALKKALGDEANATIDAWLDSGSPLSGWYAGDTAYVNKVNAPVYGLTSTSDALVATLVPNQQRFGVLTLPAFLGTHADPDSSSPVLRGSTVLRRFLCLQLPAVPTNVPPLPPRSESPAKTTRERFSMHTSAAACSACHRFIDPAGLTLENFDSVGAYRTQENGFDVDASGALVATPTSDQPLSGPGQLSAALLASADAEKCVATQVLRTLHARTETTAVDACQIERAAKVLHADGSVWGVFEALVANDQFTTRELTGATP